QPGAKGPATPPPSASGQSGGNGAVGRPPDRLPCAVGNEGPEDPHRLARLYLSGRCSHAGKTTLIFHRGQFWRWEGDCYRPVESEELAAGLTSGTKAEFDRFNEVEVLEWQVRGFKDRAGRIRPAPETRKVTRVLLANI